MNVTTYDIFVCHTGEVPSTRTVDFEYILTSADTGAGLYVLSVGANPSDRATSVDNQLVCIRQSSISSRNFFSRLNLQSLEGLPMPTVAM